jgi:hypothetical protein
MLNRVKKAQGKQQNQNRQNQQTRRKDARQNILDRKRGIQVRNYDFFILPHLFLSLSHPFVLLRRLLSS